MLSCALKAVWLALCALGTLATWFVLWFLGKATNTYWLPLLYCIGLATLEGILCLSMIYQTLPSQIPRSFCLAQTFIVSFSALLLTGVGLTVILAVSTAVIWPSSINASPQSTLRWKWGYLVPLLVVPVTFASAQLALVIKYDAYSPSDNIHCDVTGPHLWLALLGYAGMPALESLPCLAISIVTIFRVHNMYTSHQQTGLESQTRSLTSTELRPASSLFSRSHISRSTIDLDHELDFDLDAQTLTAPSVAVISTHSSIFAKAGRAPPTPQFRSVISPPPPSLQYTCSSNSRSYSPLWYSAQSRSPTLGPSSPLAGSFSPRSGFESFELQQKASMDTMDRISVLDAFDSTAALTQHWPAVGTGAFAFVPHEEEVVQGKWNKNEEKYELVDDDIGLQQDPMAINWDELSQLQARPDTQASFMSLIWRLVLFYLFFFLVQILVTLSTMIDVSRGKQALMPFGTQNVALLLAAWGPSVVFAHAPGIRVHLVRLFRRSR